MDSNAWSWSSWQGGQGAAVYENNQETMRSLILVDDDETVPEDQREEVDPNNNANLNRRVFYHNPLLPVGQVETGTPGAGDVPQQVGTAQQYILDNAPDIVASDWPRRTNLAGQELAGTRMEEAQILEYLDIQGPYENGNLQVKIHPFGLSRMTLNIPRNRWDSTTLNLGTQGGGPVASENPERVLALLTSFLANAFDPRRAPYRGHFWEDQRDAAEGPKYFGAGQAWHPSYVLPADVDGLTVDGVQIDANNAGVALLSHNNHYPGSTNLGQGAKGNYNNLRQMINRPKKLYAQDMIVKYYMPSRALRLPNAAMNRSNAAAPFQVNYFDPYLEYLAINRRRLPGGGSAFLPIHKNERNYLRMLYRACMNAPNYLRETNSNDADDRYLTVGRIVMFQLDHRLRAEDLPDILPQELHYHGAKFDWVGCNNGSQVKRLKVGTSTCVAPKSSDSSHNCLLACLRYGRNEFKKKMKVIGNTSAYFSESDVIPENAVAKTENGIIRSFVGISDNSPINITNQALMEKIGTVMKTSFVVRHAKTREMIVDVLTTGAPIIVDLLYFPPEPDSNIGHVVYETGQKTVQQWCQACGAGFLNKHKCNKDRVDFVKFQMNTPATPAAPKATNMFEVSQPDQWLQKEGFRFDWNTVIYFDMETFQNAEDDNLGSKQHVPYSIGWWNGDSVELVKGVTCLDAFLEYLQRQEPQLHPHQPKKGKPRYLPITLAAWNGARYDFKILLNYILHDDLWSTCVSVKEIVINGGKLMRFDFTFDDSDVVYQVFDPVLWIASSLDKACKSYGVSAGDAKGVFPHKLMINHQSIFRSVDLEDLNRTENYFQHDADKIKNEPWSAERLQTIGVSMAADGTYSLEQIHDYYLTNDVVSMKLICCDFFSKLDSLFDAHSFKFITISQFTFAQFAKHSGYVGQIFTPRNTEEYDLMRAAVYGGRVYPVQHHFMSSQVDLEQLLGVGWQDKPLRNGERIANNIGLTFESLTDCLVEKDVTSLYPFAMSANEYPLGQHTALSEDDIKGLNQRLARQKGTQHQLPFFIAKVKYVPNRHLIHAVLPKRSKNGGISWDLFPGEGVFTSVEIEMALLCSYDLHLVEGITWPCRGKIFESHIARTFKIKEEGDREGNPVKRAIGKLMSNSTFGKLLQANIRDTTQIVRSKAQLRRMAEEYDISDINIINDECVIASGSKPEVTYTKPYHLGAFVLSYARAQMFINQVMLQPYTVKLPELMTMADQKASLVESYHYTDTDCMYVKPGHRPMIEGTELGKLKDESLGGSGKIFMASFLGKKQYMYLLINKKNEIKLVLRCKGISEPFLRFSDYIHAKQDRNFHRETNNEEAIKSHGKDHSFMVQTIKTKRTFHKTPFGSRLPIDVETRKLDIHASHTIPHGHVLDTFGMGELWWNRYHAEADADTEPREWCLKKKTTEERLKEERTRLMEERRAEEALKNEIDAGEIEDWEVLVEDENNYMDSYDDDEVEDFTFIDSLAEEF